MNRLPAITLACVAGMGCATAPDPAPAPAAQAERADPQMAALQTSLTELLERMDVLNDRIQRLEERVATTPVPASPAPRDAAEGAVPPPQAPQPAVVTRGGSALRSAAIADNYRRAVSLYAGGRAAESRTGFQDVYEADPNGDLADNALFWIGETYFGAGDYVTAMRYYKRVLTEFPNQNKAPDALFKMALGYEKTGDLALARSTFEELIRKYPYSTSAATAARELKRIQY